MKLIIDIPKEVVDTETYAEYFGAMSVKLYDTLKNGQSIPDNTTNGNMIMNILKTSDCVRSTKNIWFTQEEIICIEVGRYWWDALYQKGESDETDN